MSLYSGPALGVLHTSRTIVTILHACLAVTRDLRPRTFALELIDPDETVQISDILSIRIFDVGYRNLNIANLITGRRWGYDRERLLWTLPSDASLVAGGRHVARVSLLVALHFCPSGQS